MLVDTPGFDDTGRTDSEILTDISRLLAAQYEAGVSLKGVIYLHRITDVRYQGSSLKALNIFKKICGQLALKNVLLVTTRWNEVDEAVGASREKQLREDFWAYMLSNGSTMTRFHGTKDSAMVIVSELMSKQTIVLELQRELVDEGKTLQETAAGGFINENISELKAQYEQEVRDLDELRRQLQESDRTMKRKIQQDWAHEQQMLRTVQEDQERLRRDIAAEVRQEIAQKTKKKRSGVQKMLPLLPTLLSIVGMFVGIPPGCTNLLTSWLSESDIGESASDFISDL